MASYSETVERIYNLRGGMIDLRLDRVDRALALFDHPERKFSSIHIAGTNGKGSTSAMIHRILSLAGYRTALYTSPHLVSFTERIKIGDDEISEEDVVAVAEEIWRRTQAADVPLTFFEIVTVMAFIYFARQRIDIAVVEVGLGGRLDATNVITPLVSVITTVSKDHEAYLGSNLLSIAREKAGIIKPGIPVVCGALAQEVAELVKQTANDLRSQVHFLGNDFKFFLKNERFFDYTGIKRHFSRLSVSLRGRHQKYNAAVALAALERVQERFPTDEAAIRQGLLTVIWPGRLEVMIEQPTVIIDGAHNGEGVRALLDELGNFRGRKIKLLFAAMADKEWELMLAGLTEVVHEVIFTKVGMERSADPVEMEKKFSDKITGRTVLNSRAGLQMLLNESRPDDVIVVAGSLYLLGEIRPMLEKIADSKVPGNA